MPDIFSSLALKGQNPYFAKLLGEGMSSAPIQSHWQGASRLAHALLGGLEMRDQDREQKAAQALRMNLPGLEQGEQTAAPTMAPQAAAPSGNQNFANAIAGIESGGKYDAQGPVINKGSLAGDRAYGKYQIMGTNVGPWTQQFVGQKMTPEQFLANPQAQDAVFNGKFGEYSQKYGPEGASRAWFAGEKGMNNPNARDQLGTTVAQYGQKFAQAAGVDPAALPPNAQPTQGYAVPGQQGSGNQRSPVQIDPAMQRQIRAMLGSRDPAVQQQGMELYKQYAKPREEARPLNEAEKKIYPGAVALKANGEPIFPPPSTNVQLSTVANPVLEGVGKQIVAQREKAQIASHQTVPMIHDARKLLDEGAITGATADLQLMIRKVGTAFGMSDDKVSNTEAFKSAIGNEVLAHIKALGANPSNADRDYIEKVQGGQIKLDESSLRKILDMTEKYARNTIKAFNADAKKLMDAQPDSYKGIAPLMGFDDPPAYAAPQRQVPAAPQPARSGVRRFNPATGKIE